MIVGEPAPLTGETLDYPKMQPPYMPRRNRLLRKGFLEVQPEKNVELSDALNSGNIVSILEFCAAEYDTKLSPKKPDTSAMLHIA